MANWGTIAGQVRAPSSVTRPQSAVTTFTHVPDVVYNYGTIAGQIRTTGGSTEIVEVIVYQAPPPSNDDPGDHITQLFKEDDIDPNLNRHTKYMVGSNVRTVIKEYWFSNTSGSSRTITFWLGGLQKQLTLTAGAETTVELWRVLYPADLIELQATGSGVATIWSGVEEVT